VKIDNFFAELKRRNVYKVAVAYAVVAWLLVQAASILLPTFEAPTWVMKALVVIIALGFALAVSISWAFEMTPEGMKRTADVSSDELRSLPYWSKRKFVAFIIGIAVIAAALLAFQLLRQPGSRIASNADSKSIAVLPFESLSEEKSNAYFADGIQDEILARLSKIGDLKVISRTSTQKYKSAPNNLREIAQQLGVANILEGSVQKAGNQVRITVQLINALKDDHLWADTYDRKMIDIFGIESDVAQKIAASLEAKLTGREKRQITVRGTDNAEAYDAFLHALALSNRQGTQDLEELIKYARRAVELDPNYAQAWCLLAVGESQKYFYPETNETQLARARLAAETAMRLAPDLAEGPAAMGIFSYYCLHDYDAALAQFQVAHERAPNDANMLLSIGLVKRRQGHIEDSIAVQQEAARLDPLNEDVWTNIGRGFRGLRRFEEARTMFDRALAIAPGDLEIVSQRAETYAAQGDIQTAWRIMEPLDFPPTDRGFGGKVVLLVFQRRFDEAEQMILKSLSMKDLPPLFIAINHSALAYARLQKGDRAEAHILLLQAETELNKLRTAGDKGVLLREVLLGVEANLGHSAEAQALADSLLKTTRNDLWQYPSTEESVARAYVALHDFDRAIPLLEHAVQTTSVEALTAAYLRVDPSWDPIRNDPRFQKLASSKP
jgi:TolB-like protein/Flp pilus assembly protein TadD